MKFNHSENSIFKSNKDTFSPSKNIVKKLFSGPDFKFYYFISSKKAGLSRLYYLSSFRTIFHNFLL